MKTLSCTRKDDFVYKLDPVVAFCETYLEYPRLSDFALIELGSEAGFGQTSDAPWAILRVFILPPLSSSSQTNRARQNYLLSFSLMGSAPVIDLVSYDVPVKSLIRRHTHLIPKEAQLGDGQLIINHDQSISFPGREDSDHLAAYLVSAVGFKTDGKVAAGEEMMAGILERA